MSRPRHVDAAIPVGKDDEIRSYFQEHGFVVAQQTFGDGLMQTERPKSAILWALQIHTPLRVIILDVFFKSFCGAVNLEWSQSLTMPHSKTLQMAGSRDICLPDSYFSYFNSFVSCGKELSLNSGDVLQDWHRHIYSQIAVNRKNQMIQ